MDMKRLKAILVGMATAAAFSGLLLSLTMDSTVRTRATFAQVLPWRALWLRPF